MNDIKKALDALVVNGMIKPLDVINAASDKCSPLHAHFEWDDTKAAGRWRMEQARQLIRSVTIVINDAVPTVVRAYVSLPADREFGAGYRHIQDVLDSDFLLAQLLAEISAKVEQWENRAVALHSIVDFSVLKTSVKKAKKR